MRLSYRPPFEGDELFAFLARRAVPGVEEVADGVHRRSLRLPRGAGIAELRPADGHVEARLLLDDERDLDSAIERCRRLLALDADPEAILAHLRDDPLIGDLVRSAPGRRVPGTVDAHELAVRAVLGQQISLSGASTLAARLVAAFGEPLRTPKGTLTHLFPSAEALAAADLSDVGMPRSRRRAITALAKALAAGDIDLGPAADRAEAVKRLLALPGIGPWTASYISMRALEDPDAFLPTDLGIRRALALLGQPATEAAALRLGERWRPYRAAASQHLWAILTKPAAPSVQQAA
ncbi:MAG TPA: DNA-3-methyladenine glycosylase [Thermoleophilaceae bacterium]|nr:DNA-3-methyladenine glycosylase [Thermoleophilaceae bacterium]